MSIRIAQEVAFRVRNDLGRKAGTFLVSQMSEVCQGDDAGGRADLCGPVAVAWRDGTVGCAAPEIEAAGEVAQILLVFFGDGSMLA